jgi:hypothetical protein
MFINKKYLIYFDYLIYFILFYIIIQLLLLPDNDNMIEKYKTENLKKDNTTKTENLKKDNTTKTGNLKKDNVNIIQEINKKLEKYKSEIKLLKEDKNSKEVNNLNNNLNNKCNNNKLCIDPCPSRNTIQNEIVLLSDNITAMNIKYKKLNSNIKELENKIDNIDKGDVKTIVQEESDDDVSDKIRNESSKKAKAKSIKDTSESISAMSDISPSKSKKLLENHYSKPVTHNSLNDFKSNMPDLNKEDIKNHNKIMG